MAISITSKGVTIVKRVTVGKPVRKVNAAVTSIDNIIGVDTTGKENEHILQYNSTSGNWESVAQTATGSLEGLSDVSTAGKVNGSVLVYNSSSDLFEASTQLEEQNINGGQY